jgi:thiol:disulfide interchange protein
MRFFGVLLAIWLLGASPAAALAPGYLGYDPDADPAKDLELAVEQATRDGKRIILVVGGEWCIWCKILQDFLILNRDVKQQWDDNYITIKVYFGPENQNQPFLSQFPEINGYPHLFVLDSDGSLLHSQRTAELESRESYSKKKVTRFLDSWRPGS